MVGMTDMIVVIDITADVALITDGDVAVVTLVAMVSMSIRAVFMNTVDSEFVV